MSYIFGMPSLIEYKNIEDNLILCDELGLSFLEMNLNLPYCLPEFNDIEFLKDLIIKYNNFFTFHFPEEIDFAVFYPSIRKSNIQFFKEICKYGEKLETKIINIHINPGIHFSLPDKKIKIYKEYINDFLCNLVYSITEISKISNNYGIKLCIENTSFTDYIEEAFYLLSKIENVYFTYDTGHDEKDNHKASNFYELNSDRVKHFHLHDSDGKSDHLELFSGKIDFNKVFNHIYRNSLTSVIEVKTKESLRKSIFELKKRITF